MSINSLIFRSLKKNIKNYYLYVFALIFSAALYFAFVTLQYDPAMNETKGSIKGAAALRTATVLLIAIVSVFLIYANNIFIKRRSKEIGLFQLIGMTKNKIFCILTAENFILYFSSLIIGIFLGFSVSKLLMLILYKITGIETEAVLQFSIEALFQTIIVFVIIYLFIMLMNFIFINKQSILSLFKVTSSSEEKVKKVSVIEMVIGILGIVFIIAGYYISSELFDGKISDMNGLFLTMILILAAVIIGTYLFYKGSVRFIFYLIRKKKDGYLNIKEVLSLSSIMFRMKSNALLLTIITTVSALAIGLLSLSYISYYSAEKMVKNYSPSDFSLISIEDAEEFKKGLTGSNIPFNEKKMEIIQVQANVKQIMETPLEELNFDPNTMIMPFISDEYTGEIDVSEEETLFTGYSDVMQSIYPLKGPGQIGLKGKNESFQLKFLGLNKDYLISSYFTMGVPLGIVDKSTFERLKKDINQEIQRESSFYIGIEIEENNKLQQANELFQELALNERNGNESQLNLINFQKQNMGLMMFIVGFLGLTFLVTSGCILYFKQMDESEDEKSNYTILRKLGFTQGDLLKGIQLKQLYNFGIPLIIGLSHSYFAVKSGWFFFGTELWSPMLIVMVLYTALYSIFGILSVLYYKKVIKEAL